ncbi:MAG: DinB family protein [Gemmatimonadaceae bacterium]
MPKPTLDSAAELPAAFNGAATAVSAAVERASEGDLERQWSMHAGDRVIFKGTKREVLRQVMLSHMIHHRAQLGVSYPLLDVPVPGLYGPSADE